MQEVLNVSIIFLVKMLGTKDIFSDASDSTRFVKVLAVWYVLRRCIYSRPTDKKVHAFLVSHKGI